ncbi:MAG: hypothetical protein K2H10_00360, partial [Bacteroidales bacterium]|nr:hypothetical protein [Bacteroidales bacterium]
NMINELDKSYAIDQHYRRGLAEGEAKGEARGRQEGFLEGEAKGARETAMKTASRLLKEGIPAETVSKCTGLSIEEVLKLQDCGYVPMAGDRE